MSAKSDKYEADVAKYINSMPGIQASRPSVSTGFSDIVISKFDNRKVSVPGSSMGAWLEVKMSHTDNLSNPRAFYKGGKWQTTYKTPVAHTMVEELNKSPVTKKFHRELAKFSGIPLKSLIIPTSKTMLKEPGAVPLHIMKQFVDQPGRNRYILSNENTNLGKVVTEHYVKGKEQPAYYMQAGDDFYRISNKNPLKLKGIPLLVGNGDFRVRIGTRREFYEVQAEIKIKKMPTSKFSLQPGSNKLNPLLKANR